MKIPYLKYRGKRPQIFNFLVLHDFDTNLTSILQNVRVLIDFSYTVAIWKSSDGSGIGNGSGIGSGSGSRQGLRALHGSPRGPK